MKNHIPKAAALLLALTLAFAPGCGPSGVPREETVIPEEAAAPEEPAEAETPTEYTGYSGIEAGYYPSENTGTKFIRHGMFTFWLEVPSEWRAYDWSVNGWGYKVESGDDNIVMGLSGSRDFLTNSLPDFIFNRDDGSVLSEFVFDSGISGWQIEKTDEFIEFIYRSKGRFPTFYVNYEKDPAWFAENREKIIDIAKTMNDGAHCDGVVFTGDMKTLVSYPEDKEDEAYTVPDGVMMIEGYAFLYCEHLARIIIPGSVTSIEGDAFSHAQRLREISVAEDSENYASRDGVLFSKDMKTLVYYPPAKKDPIYEIPDGVTRIQFQAFADCENLVKITVPDSVTSIEGDAAILTGRRLREITVAEGNDRYASQDGVLFTKSMKTLMKYPPAKEDSVYEIPTGVQHIQCEAFWVCENLTEVIFPDSVKSIADFSFVYLDLTIRAGEDSYAAKYARSCEIAFEPVPEI
jgi:hypothetical protein